MVFLQNRPESESFCLESQMTEPDIFLCCPPCQLESSVNRSLSGCFYQAEFPPHSYCQVIFLA